MNNLPSLDSEVQPIVILPQMINYAGDMVLASERVDIQRFVCEMVALTLRHAERVQYTSDSTRFADEGAAQKWLNEAQVLSNGMPSRLIIPFYTGTESLIGVVWLNIVGATLDYAIRTYPTGEFVAPGHKVHESAISCALQYLLEQYNFYPTALTLSARADNSQALAFYIKMGFTSWDKPDGDLDRLYMVKFLQQTPCGSPSSL